MRTQILIRKFGWALLLLPLVACGGGGGGGGGGDDGGPEVLFADDFSGGTVLPDWVPNPLSAATIDWAHGDPSIPCLNLHDGRARLNDSFAAYAGLDFFVRVMLPDDTHCLPLGAPDPAICCSSLLEVYSSQGAPVAGVEYFRWHCVDGTRIIYWIKNAMGNVVEETLPNGYFTGQFSDFSFHLRADGSAEWRRDGVVKQTLPVTSGWGTLRTDISYTLDLFGERIYDGVVPVGTGFDDVLVQR